MPCVTGHTSRVFVQLEPTGPFMRSRPFKTQKPHFAPITNTFHSTFHSSFTESKALLVNCNKSISLFYQVQKSQVMQININPRDFPVDFKCLKKVFQDTCTKTTNSQSTCWKKEIRSRVTLALLFIPFQTPWIECGEHRRDCFTVLFKHLMSILITKAG